MQRSQLEHVIRAAGAITNLRDIIVIGSQAVLADALKCMILLLQSPPLVDATAISNLDTSFG